MALQNWDDGGLAQQLGLNDAMLIAIINACMEAAGSMASVRAQVDNAASTIRMAMQSDAGLILQNRLGIWHEDYSRIVNAFVGPDSLMQRAEALLLALQRANADATATAGAGQA